MKLEKLFQNNCSFTYHQELNTWGGTKTISGTDKAKWVTEDDPGFPQKHLRNSTSPSLTMELISRLPVRFQVQSVIHVGENNLNYLISKQDET